MVDKIPDMNVLASFTIVQLIAHGMLLPLLMCFPMGTALQAAQHSLGASYRALPGWERCWGLASAAASCVQPLHRAKGEQARTAWLSSTGYLCSCSVPSFPSLTEEFRGCCRGKEMVKGKVRCFGQGGKRLHSLGWVRGVSSVCPWEGGSERAGAHAG